MLSDSSEKRLRFRRIIPRQDINEIRVKCSLDSIEFRDKGQWNTSYNDTYRQYPYSARPPIPPPPTSISLGGGKLAPNREEMRSNYTNTFHPFEKGDFAKKEPPIPDSQFLPRDYAVPKLSMTQLEMEATGSLPRDPYTATQTARAIAKDQRINHFNSGFDRTNYTTTTNASYQKRKPVEQPVSDGFKNRVSIEFDKKAGLGPHEKSLTKRRWAPSKPDAEPLDQHNKNFDTGYNKPDYMTTTRASFTTDSRFRYAAPPAAQPPPCAEFSNDGPYAPTWTTTNATEFTRKKPVPNEIDVLSLRKTNWDQGHDKNEWPTPEPPKTARRYPKAENQNASNQVFRGDGQMEFNTTVGDMIGTYDKNEALKARLPQSNEARLDHMFVGSDAPNYTTSVKEMNKMAGKGGPAQICEDYSKKRGPCYARGGDWDRFKGKELIEDKEYSPVGPTPKVDGSYYRKSHFDLDATNTGKPKYLTTYYETICKPTLENPDN